MKETRESFSSFLFFGMLARGRYWRSSSLIVFFFSCWLLVIFSSNRSSRWFVFLFFFISSFPTLAGFFSCLLLSPSSPSSYESWPSQKALIECMYMYVSVFVSVCVCLCLYVRMHTHTESRAGAGGERRVEGATESEGSEWGREGGGRGFIRRRGRGPESNPTGVKRHVQL